MSEKKQATRLYIANNKDGKPAALVRAVSVSQARSYMAQTRFDVGYAEQDDIVKAVKAGIEEESAVEISTEGESENLEV